MTAGKRGQVMVIIGSGILDGEERSEKVSIVWQTDEINREIGLNAQVCKVFKA